MGTTTYESRTYHTASYSDTNIYVAMTTRTCSRSQPPRQQSDASNDGDPVGPSAAMSCRKWDYDYFQTPSQSSDTGSTSEGLVELLRSPIAVSARLAQEGGSGTSQGQRRQPQNFSTTQSSDYEESPEDKSVLSGNGLRKLRSTSSVTRAINIDADRQAATNFNGGAPARDRVGRSQAGGAKQKKLEKQALPPNSAWRKSPFGVPLVCFLLLLLAGRASGTDCGASNETIVPSVVENTAGALQLAEAMDCVDGGSFSVEWVGFVTLARPIILSGTMSLNVTGAENKTSWVDGASQHSLFQVWNGGALFLSGLNLLKGSNNNGGAIYASSSSISVTSCSFVENNATYGGAVHAYFSRVTVANSSFIENNATYGGAINAHTSNNSVTNCTFIGNKATSGGGIFLLSSTIALSTVNFSRNFADSNQGFGGAICTYSSSVGVDNVSCVGNNAIYGGAIFLVAANILLAGANFSRNLAEQSGGAIYGEGNVTIVANGNNVWDANTAIYGGAIRLHHSCFIKISGSARITRNVADQGGGVWLSENTTMTTFGSVIFDANSAAEGGGMIVFDSFVHFLTGSTICFSNNSGNEGGGAVHAYFSQVTAANSSFIENNASYGGAVHAYFSRVTVANSSFIENNATYGGAINAHTSNNSVTNCTFIGNKATSGGGIFLLSSTIALSTVNFFGNLADGNQGFGGAICTYSSSVGVDNVSCVGNNAIYGGAIFLVAANILLADANFSRNLAEQSGGAIYGEGNVTIVANGNTMWDANTAVYGGAIRLYYSCFIKISGSARITRNVADQGGGVWLSENSTMTMFGSVIFDANSAAEGGGMIVFDSFVHFLVGSHARFINNTAQTGGAIMMQEGAAANISGDVTMSKNVASSSGGAMHCEATTSLVVFNVRFASNHAGSSGGAITALSSGTRDKSSIISLSSFEDNVADDAGGAMFIAGGFVDIKGSTFTRNTAGRSGGAVLTSGITSVDYCIFTNNRAFTGPAVSNTVSVFISWTVFDDNALLCDDGYFLDFSTNVSAYETVCYDCYEEVECDNCTVRNKDKVQVCESVLAHTASPSVNGTLQSLELHKGFWRISSTSKDVRECYEADACVGGVETYCAVGYTGPYCAVCMDGYARGLGNLCLRCSEERRSLVIALATVFIAVIVAAIVVRIRFLAPGTEAENFLRRMLEMAKSRFKGARLYQALKIVVVSWQIVTQFSEVASVTYPDLYEAFLRYLDVFNLNLGWMLSAGCLVKTNFYAELLVSTIGPLILAFLVLASYRVNSWRCPIDDDQARSRSRNNHGAFLFGFSLLLYSTVSSSIFQTFACDELDNGKSYLRSDYSLECYTVEHKIIMSYASVMAILYPFGIPFCYGLILHRKSRETSTDLTPFEDLWRPYRREVFFYEVIDCLRRVVLSGIVVFVFPNTAGQVAMTFLFALAFFAVLLVLNPYTDQWDTWLARFGHAIVMMSMFVALLQKVDASDDDMFNQNVFGGVLIAANCVMILAVGAEASGLCFLTFR